MEYDVLLLYTLYKGDNMGFTSFDFYIFLAIVVGIYYLIPLKYRWYSLLAGSLLFYWYISEYSKHRFIILVGETLICWLLSHLMKKIKGEGRRKLCLVISILFTAIPILAIKMFPYVNNIAIHKPMPEWWLVPVGIAFWSMQLIAYTVDVYKDEINPEKNFLKFLLFASFFPQIIQGPIPRFAQLSAQLTEGNRFDENKFVKGFMLILWGFFLKLCIADKAGVIVDTVFNNYPAYCGMYILVAGVLYSLQLYTDFLACTSFAQGISGLFGINIINNFNHPYFSTSVKDFWRRWHISFSYWLRDYVYIPLGGSRKGKIRKFINLLITFAISGIWHGSGLKFLFWGLIHGTYQIIGEMMEPIKKSVNRKLNLNKHQEFANVCKTIFTFSIIMLAWIIFRADHLRTGLSMIKSIFTVYNPWILTNDSLYNLGLGWKECMVLGFCLFVLLIVSWKQERGVRFTNKILECNLFTRWFIYIGTIIFVIIFGTYGYGYDPQEFIYGGF